MTARMAMLLAGIPETVPIVAVNRLCSSGLEVMSVIASKIKAGFIDIGIAGGVESMSIYSIGKDLCKDSFLSKEAKADSQSMACRIPFGVTSETVAEKYGVTREQQDKLAYESHMKAAKAQSSGLFKSNS